MMRPIKFRVWNRPFKRMHAISCLQVSEDGIDMLTTDGDHYQLDPTQGELMQYTGLHDSKGLEIYEGDILKVTEEDENSYTAPVIWGGKDYPAFDLDAHYVPDGWYYEANILSTLEAGLGNSLYEVVGNIYENPELLEVQE